MSVIPGTLPPGSMLGGYRIIGTLGRGGMGVVYKAEDARLGRLVAIKVIGREVSDDPLYMARFHREAQAAARVAHPHITPIFFIGDDAKTTFLVFELLPGGSLRARLKKHGRIPWPEAARLAAQVAHGLEAIHAAGLVHRDLKPDNVLLDANGMAKIADFGLVRRVDPGSRQTQGALTRDGEVLGTLDYMSPEQVDGQPADARADLYSLGAMLHALVAGRPPFAGDSPFELMKKQLADPPPRLRELVPDVPPELERLVLCLLEKAPERRPQGASEVAAELDALAASASVPPPIPRSRSRLAALAILATACAAAGASFLIRRPDGRDEPPVAPPPPTPPPVRTAAEDPVKPLPTDDREVPAERLPPAFATLRRIEGDGAHAVLEGAWGTPCWSLFAGGTCVAEVAGSLVAVGSADGRINLFDARSGSVRGTVLAHDYVNALAVASRGERLFSGGSAGKKGSVAVWDARSLALVTRFALDANVVTVSPTEDGKRILCACTDGTVHLWDVGAGRPGEPVVRLERGVTCAAMTPDGRRAVVSGHGPAGPTLELVDLGNPSPRQLERPRKEVVSVAIARDGRSAATCEKEGEVRRWDLAAKESKVIDRKAISAAISPDGRTFASSGEDGTVRLWDVEQASQRRELRWHHGRANGVAFSADGRTIYSTSSDRTVVAWDVATGKQLASPRVLCHMAVTPDGRQAALATLRGAVELWDVRERRRAACATSDEPVYRVGISSDGRTIARGFPSGGDVLARDGQRFVARRALAAKTRYFGLCFVERDRELVSAGDDGVLRLWSTEGDAEPVSRSFRGKLLALGVSPGGSALVLGCGKETCRVERAAGRLGDPQTLPLEAQTSLVRSTAVDSTGRIASLTEDGVLFVRVPEKGLIWRVETGCGGSSAHTAFSPGGRFLLSAGLDTRNGRVKVFAIKDGAPREVLAIPLALLHDHPVGAAFCTDGELLVASARGYVLRYRID